MSTENPEIVIVGAGLGGICAAINLLRTGERNFVILEKAGGVGGTWRYNTYPGAACDVMSTMYSYSFAAKTDWTKMYVDQPEIKGYIEEVFDRYGLQERTRFDTEVLSYTYDDADGRWRVEVAGGEVLTPRVVVAGLGALHRPLVPDFEGQEQFTGRIVHAARWDSDIDLTGKKVAVVGVGSSSVQIVPAIAGTAKQVYVIQRTPQWVLPKPNRAYSRFERALFRILPASQKLYRNVAYWSHEAAIILFMNPRLLSVLKGASMRLLRKQVPDPQLRAKLVPDYTIGCKRILLSSDYYPALMRDDVTLVDSPITEFEATGFRTADGELREVDVVILATGFDTHNRLENERITGRDGRTIQELWGGGMRAHLGTTIAGLPNFFMLMGPNSGGGSQSILFVLEAQAHYIAQCVRLLRSSGARSMEIRADVEREFNEQIHAKLARSVWNSGGCDSWFLDRNGVNRQAWPGSSANYWRLTRKPRPEWFELKDRALDPVR